MLVISTILDKFLALHVIFQKYIGAMVFQAEFYKTVSKCSSTCCVHEPVMCTLQFLSIYMHPCGTLYF